jgi:hypothetical protein
MAAAWLLLGLFGSTARRGVMMLFEGVEDMTDTAVDKVKHEVLLSYTSSRG